ncbi:hypothetical protein [Nocardia blacklockiae]|uniref:hypothetical protein n=1 Tax=Nocardia blacklockiae TaxID=480036 RepID=UPI001892D9A1|nr:hypothetical protein [Nocardia blacklockiae]MBF6175069.1 hypothetical protein [Nocardia blacklockiae]
MTSLSSVERLLGELTARYGSVEAMFESLDLLRADPGAPTAVLPVVAAASGGRHRAR